MVVAQERDKDREAKPSPRRRRGEVFIIRERCKGCGFCVEFCPTHVLVLDREFNSRGYHPPVVANPDACTGCDLCGLYCPDFAIHGERSKGASEVSDES